MGRAEIAHNGFVQRNKLVHDIFVKRAKSANTTLKVREKAGLAAVRSKGKILINKRC